MSEQWAWYREGKQRPSHAFRAEPAWSTSLFSACGGWWGYRGERADEGRRCKVCERALKAKEGGAI